MVASRVTRALAPFVASLAAASHASAAELLVEGYKLVVKDTAASDKIVYVSRDPGVAIPINVGVDPRDTGGTFLIRTYHTGTGDSETASFPLPASNWTAVSSPKGFIFKFINQDAPAGVSGVRSLVIGQGRLKVRTMDAGVTLDEVQAAMDVRLDLGDSQWCSEFSTNITKTEPGFFVAKRQGFPPDGCTPASP